MLRGLALFPVLITTVLPLGFVTKLMVASAELLKEKVSEGSVGWFWAMLKIILVLPVKNNALVVSKPV